MGSEFDRLDEVVLRVAKSGPDAAGPLSTGERLYVGLAANNMELLDRMGYTIPEAIARIGTDWTRALVTRWQHRGDPRKFTDEQHDEPKT